MNEGPVTREEFEAFKIETLARFSDNIERLGRIMDLIEMIQQRTMKDETRLTAAERLADGCKDAVCRVANFCSNVMDNEAVDHPIYHQVCEDIAAAQRPPASAEGAEVVVKGGGQ